MIPNSLVWLRTGDLKRKKKKFETSQEEEQFK
jgi:hypothetical protein